MSAAPFLKVSDNGRFLQRLDGAPLFFLADTAWSLFQRLTPEESAQYLHDRAAKGYTVVQAVAISEFDGLRVPDRGGRLPFHDAELLQPNGAYFDAVDAVVRQANALGLVVALLPTWGDKVGPQKWGRGPVAFNADNARRYGEYLGRRLRDRALVWVLGGDRNPDSAARRGVWRAMAAGLQAGDGGRHLMSYHPVGVGSSTAFFPDEPWLSFHMLQSCHLVADRDNYNQIAQDYSLEPPRPCMDAEPCYEDMPIAMRPGNPRFSAWDARKAAWWAVLAGAHGHTYGANGVFQFWDGERHDPAPFDVRLTWQQALQLPGAAQMQHLRRAIESRPMLSRLPDPQLLLSNPLMGAEHIRASRCAEGGYALVYSASGQPFTLDMARLGSGSFDARWLDPRSGDLAATGQVSGSAPADFTPPSHGPGHDWVLCLDRAPA